MSIKTSINSIEFTEKRRFEEINITQVVIQNYSNVAVSVTQKDVTRLIPGATKVLGVDVPSMPFVMNDNGNYFDTNLIVDFPNGPGRVIIDYNKAILELDNKKC
jgi:hypothetical protein